MPELLYLVGAPASGKSTLAAHLVRDLPARPVPAMNGLPARIMYGNGSPVATQLGKLRASFPGTDTLPMNVGPHARNLLVDAGRPELLLAEGDRLSTATFFDAAVEAGYTLVVCAVIVDSAVLTTRRLERAEAGWSPDAAWLKGRDTKADRQAERADVIVPGHNLTAATDYLLASSEVAQALEAARAHV
jgi:hypothetical protein